MKSIDKILLLLLPVISIGAEIFKSFDEPSKVMAARNYLCLLLVIFLLSKYLLKTLQFNTTLVLLGSYLLLALITQDAYADAYTVWINVFEAKLMLPLAFILLSGEKENQHLSIALFITGALFALFILLFLIFGIGENQYGGNDGFTAGSFKFSRIYTGSFIILSLPFIWIHSKQKFIRRLIPIIGLLILAILILSTRRTALIIVFTGMAVFAFYFRHRLSRLFIAILGIVLVLLLALPLYQDILVKQLEKRQHVFIEQKGFDLEQETRYEESIAVWRERIKNTDITTSLFGNHLFDSPGNYDFGVHGDRPLHLDLNVILHGSGITGLILFSLFFAELFLHFFRNRPNTLSVESKIREATFVSVFLSMILLVFSGGMAAVTHNMIASLLAGSCLAGMVADKKRQLALELSTQQKPSIYYPRATPISAKSQIF